MAGPLRIVSAATVTLETLAAAVTEAFAGYFYPMTQDAAQFSRRIRLEQIDLRHSLLAYDHEDLAGCCLLAIRGDVGWVAGFAIAPRQRGRGRGGELMTAVLEQARSCCLRRLGLEVLTRNAAAIRLYRSVGMSIARDLLLLERRACPAAAGQGISLRKAPAGKLLLHFVRLHRTSPSWGRDLPALLVVDGIRGLCLGKIEAPTAYALLRDRADGSTSALDLAACDGSAAFKLCAGLNGISGLLRVINEPEESLFLPALKAHGFFETDRQHEMLMEL